MKKIVKKAFAKIKPFLLLIVSFEAKVARSWAAKAHKRLYNVDWKISPEPEFFNHNIDLYWAWPKSGNSLWLERGVFGSLSLKPNGRVLELCCGDGFNSKYFYSHRVDSIISVDFDPMAIKLANTINQGTNIDFRVCDIRYQMPDGNFENVIWDAAIEHFTLSETDKILTDIKSRLNRDGILSGYTNAELSTGNKSLSHHEHEFKNKEELADLLSGYFKKVVVFETIFPSRQNLYFWASDDGVIPFSPDWSASCVRFKN